MDPFYNIPTFVYPKKQRPLNYNYDHRLSTILLFSTIIRGNAGSLVNVIGAVLWSQGPIAAVRFPIATEQNRCSLPAGQTR